MIILLLLPLIFKPVKVFVFSLYFSVQLQDKNAIHPKSGFVTAVLETEMVPRDRSEEIRTSSQNYRYPGTGSTLKRTTLKNY